MPKCPYCGSDRSCVIDMHSVSGYKVIQTWVCPSCDHFFTANYVFTELRDGKNEPIEKKGVKEEEGEWHFVKLTCPKCEEVIKIASCRRYSDARIIAEIHKDLAGKQGCLCPECQAQCQSDDVLILSLEEMVEGRETHAWETLWEALS